MSYYTTRGGGGPEVERSLSTSSTLYVYVTVAEENV